MTEADLLTHDGITQPITEWALNYGIPAALIVERIEHGWTIAHAIETEMKPAGRPKRKRRSNNKYRRYLTFKGRTRWLAQWSRITGLSVPVIRQRLALGWTVERTLTEPARPVAQFTFNGETRTATEWAHHVGMNPYTLYARLKRMPIDEALTKPMRRLVSADLSGQAPGVGPNFPQPVGTGGGSRAHECVELGISNIAGDAPCP